MMKRALFVTPIVALAILLGCGRMGLAQSSEVKSPRSMKGYELYSWKIRGQWHFTLLVGTNRLKTRSEVSSPRVRVRGLAALRKKLSRLPEGEQVSWSEGFVPGMSLPPEKMVEEIKDYCERNGITLRVNRTKRALE